MKKYALTALFLILVHYSHAQLQRRYATYNVENGLAQNSTWDILHDSRGFLWLSTADGINRYNGYEMYHYKNNSNEKHSIYGITRFRFLEDKNRDIWISHDRGVSVYNRIKDNFDNIIKSKHIYEILDIDDKNRLWVFEERLRIHLIDINKKKIIKTIKKDFLNELLNHSTSNCIRLGEFLFISHDGKDIIQIDTKTDEVSLVELKSKLPNIFRYEKTSDSTFIAFSSNETKMYEFKLSKNKLTYTRKDVLNYKPYEASSGIYKWNDKLYSASIKGLHIINSKTYQTEEYISKFDNLESSFNYIQYIGRDSSNNLYICTNGMGIKMYSPYFNKFKHYKTNNETMNMVKSIVKTKDGKIICGSFNQGLVIYYPDNTFKNISFKPYIQSQYTFNSVLGMTNYSDDEVLLVFADRLILYNHNTNKESNKLKFKFSGYQYFPTFQKIDDDVYFNTYSKTESHIMSIDKNFNSKSIYSTNAIEFITCFKIIGNKIYIGNSRTLKIYDIKKKTTLQTKLNLMVKSICHTSDNKIYVSTINGLFEISENGDILKKFDVHTGLSDDFIYSVLEDNEKNLWLSHNKGISKLIPSTKQITNYSNKDGLQSNEFNTGAFYKDELGLLYFGGVNGINVVDPSNIIKNNNRPKISINQINLNDEPYKSDSSYNEKTLLNLDYFENTLSFDFSALEFSNPALNTYKYILDGYDKVWIKSGTKHFARYANLPSGDYTLKILAANADGVWSSSPKELKIHIRTPFWQKTWFYALCILVGLLLIISIFYFILHQEKLKSDRLLKAQQELEQERLRIARDLHDHVGAQLSYLISNLDWMISHPNKLNPEEERKKLENLTEAGRQAILTLRQTIWAINNKSLTVEDFADKFKTFALKMLEIKENIHIKFSENFEINNSLNPSITLHLFRICQEALSNILKHSNAKNIVVEFISSKEKLIYFSITDDGKGFNTMHDYSNEHYGLANMKARAKECGADLNIESSESTGTKVYFEIKSN